MLFSGNYFFFIKFATIVFGLPLLIIGPISDLVSFYESEPLTSEQVSFVCEQAVNFPNLKERLDKILSKGALITHQDVDHAIDAEKKRQIETFESEQRDAKLAAQKQALSGEPS